MPNKPFKILSIDGGGLRGIYAAHILKRMEEEYDIEWLKSFDLITGTSTGAIIAAGLVCEITPKKLIKFYEDYGRIIFPKKLPFFSWFADLFRSKYKTASLAGALKKLFGDKKLGEIKFPLILPATDIGNGCVHVFKSGYSDEFKRDKEVLVSDAILASCSAPTYFDPQLIRNYLLADGGLWANNPSLVAIIDAKRRLNQNLSNLKILSIGTGCAKKSYSLKRTWWKNLFGWGFITKWGRNKLIDMILNLQSQKTHNTLKLLLGDKQILRLNFESDKPLSLDDPRSLSEWQSKADKNFAHNAKKINDFLTN
ncbi:MAG: CBASS cGAMP-activated phospholipase [Gammaproteobacteria bacterium]|jgi:patatin-like phospholipase/acyl hydrolase